MALFIPFVILLFVVAILLRVELYFTVVWFLIGAYVLARFWTQRSVAQIRVRRRFDDHAYMGDRVTVDLAIDNAGRLPVAWVELEESIPLDLRSGTFPAQAISLKGREVRHFTYDLNCRRRGYYEIGPLRVQTGDLLGIEQRLLVSQEARRLTVYPRVVPLERLGLPTRSALVTLASRMPLFEDATRIMGIRDYQPGDSPRRIHWTASARTGQLVVKQYQPAIARDTLICLDLDLRDYETRFRYDATEQAIVVAASLASHMILREKLPAGLATEARDVLVDDRRRFSLKPRSERAHLMRILEVLARAQVTPGAGYANLLREESFHISWGSTIVVITGSVDGTLAETLLYLKRGGHAVALILIQRDSRDAGPAGIPTHHVWADRDLAGASASRAVV